MSEITPEVKFFKLQKAVPGNIIFTLHPVSNPTLTKEVYLTNRQPSIMLPADWALGVFVEDGLYKMYEKGIFTFDNNDILVKMAYNQSLYFSEELDFKPVKAENVETIKVILKGGNRKAIENAISTYGEERVKEVAYTYVSELSTGVVSMLESMFKVQLTMDGGAE